MQHTIEKIIAGDLAIMGYYRLAKEHWASVFQAYRGVTSTVLSKRLDAEQRWFEHNCGGRWIGQEIMVVSGIGQFYSTSFGFDHDLSRAIWLYEAILQSYCSVEVKSVARDVAAMYGLVEAADDDL